MHSQPKEQKSFRPLIILKLVVDTFILASTWNIECNIPLKHLLLSLMITTFLIEVFSILDNGTLLKVFSVLAYVVFLGLLNYYSNLVDKCRETNYNLTYYCGLQIFFLIFMICFLLKKLIF